MYHRRVTFNVLLNNSTHATSNVAWPTPRQWRVSALLCQPRRSASTQYPQRSSATTTPVLTILVLFSRIFSICKRQEIERITKFISKVTILASLTRPRLDPSCCLTPALTSYQCFQHLPPFQSIYHQSLKLEVSLRTVISSSRVCSVGHWLYAFTKWDYDADVPLARA